MHRAGDPAGVIFCDSSLEIASNIAISRFPSGLHARFLVQKLLDVQLRSMCIYRASSAASQCCQKHVSFPNLPMVSVWLKVIAKKDMVSHVCMQLRNCKANDAIASGTICESLAPCAPWGSRSFCNCNVFGPCMCGAIWPWHLPKPTGNPSSAKSVLPWCRMPCTASHLYNLKIVLLHPTGLMHTVSAKTKSIQTLIYIQNLITPQSQDG